MIIIITVCYFFIIITIIFIFIIITIIIFIFIGTSIKTKKKLFKNNNFLFLL